MKRLKRFLAALAVAAAGFSVSADQVLYWMVDDPTVNVFSVGSKTVSQMISEGWNINMARVAATSTVSGDTVYLDMYYHDGSKWVVDPTMEFDTVEVGADGKMGGGYARASLSSKLGADYESYTYAIELGTWSDDGAWQMAAISSSQAFSELTSYVSSQVDVPTSAPWGGGGYTGDVPEPSSALLMLLGSAALVLRRKRRDAKAA